jgi:hypothetical protein
MSYCVDTLPSVQGLVSIFNAFLAAHGANETLDYGCPPSGHKKPNCKKKRVLVKQNRKTTKEEEIEEKKEKTGNGVKEM